MNAVPVAAILKLAAGLPPIERVGRPRPALAFAHPPVNRHEARSPLVMVAAATPNTIVFESEALENIPKGWKARETYEIVSPDEFVETFEIASTGAYELYSRNRFKRRCVR